MAAIRLENINVGYDENLVLRDFSLSVAHGELVALLGASGCGKTTALKIIAGLLEPKTGEIYLDEQNITNVRAEKRETAMVFQKPLLFPFMNVAENVAFGLKMRKVSAAQTAEKVAEALGLVQLEGYENRSAKQLSGGQEQRVSLARALVTDPRVLLLDEPFSALDAPLRVEMRNLVRDLQKRLAITTVFVTHDQEEAVSLADRIAFIDDGELAQISNAGEFFVNPKTPAVAKFFGWKIFEGKLNKSNVETSIGNFNVPPDKNLSNKSHLKIAFHPNRIALMSEFDKTADGVLIDGKLINKIDLGGKFKYTILLLNGESIDIERSNTIDDKKNSVKIYVPRDSIKFFA